MPTVATAQAFFLESYTKVLERYTVYKLELPARGLFPPPSRNCPGARGEGDLTEAAGSGGAPAAEAVTVVGTAGRPADKSQTVRNRRLEVLILQVGILSVQRLEWRARAPGDGKRGVAGCHLLKKRMCHPYLPLEFLPGHR
ncbi:uncharacterized protein AAG666_008736 [Megaptera novaeangliae]